MRYLIEGQLVLSSEFQINRAITAANEINVEILRLSLIVNGAHFTWLFHNYAQPTKR